MMNYSSQVDLTGGTPAILADSDGLLPFSSAMMEYWHRLSCHH